MGDQVRLAPGRRHRPVSGLAEALRRRAGRTLLRTLTGRRDRAPRRHPLLTLLTLLTRALRTPWRFVAGPLGPTVVTGRPFGRAAARVAPGRRATLRRITA
ncbi:hypothetical protein [Amycolatopsis sp. NPDC051061]|uniref:hypothetical protein n=1 Tax=Amycolatopsis sp. NPDC051061 TaxID=3155042 RepID=UPI00341E3B1F